jgi:hypothetical protein
MPLNEANCAQQINNALQNKINDPNLDFGNAFATAYDDYVKQGTITGVVNSGGTKSILAQAINSINGGPSAKTDLGNAFSSYWATVGTVPQPPYISVVSTAGASTAAFIAAVEASITNQPSNPPFEAFIKNLKNIGVSTITWTATDPNGVPITGGIS